MEGSTQQTMLFAPTTEQRAELLNHQGPIALAQFIAWQNPQAMDRFVLQWRDAVTEVHGSCACRSTIDLSLIGPPTAFTDYLIDVFPSSHAACAAYDAVATARKAALSDLLVLVLRSEDAALLRLVALASKVMHRVAGTPRQKFADPISSGAALDPDRDPTYESFQQMLALPQDVPITMLNLNRFYPQAQYPASFTGKSAVSGSTAYQRYSRSVLPHLLKRGSYPIWIGHILGVLVGERDHPLAQPWDDFIVNTYPSRLALRDMIADASYRRGLVHRDAGLAQALVLQGEPRPA
jgi:hypothetical protein